ncbi:hypothetical protein [Cellulosimicrobium protaetiae]|uniref:Uncharacterized protein n=1 Tax=Cellulosimicrobium protaetiae TaxID=2587808 RepID=A0A6M5UH01_9MICO|nr:hypothetical protein [Cellulosimicrobium protaetiae]QJW35919.1 hypothetical protein FIC82_006645 [Cellulosimicrobium protaetiae]
MRHRRREPAPEPVLDAFEDGLAVLRRDRVTVGHVATSDRDRVTAERARLGIRREDF